MDKGYYEVNRMRENYPIKVIPHQKLIDNVYFILTNNIGYQRLIDIILQMKDLYNEEEW